MRWVTEKASELVRGVVLTGVSGVLTGAWGRPDWCVGRPDWCVGSSGLVRGASGLVRGGVRTGVAGERTGFGRGAAVVRAGVHWFALVCGLAAHVLVTNRPDCTLRFDYKLSILQQVLFGH